MKTSLKSISLIVATGIAGVALFQIGSASFTAVLPGDTIAAIALSAGFVLLAAYDYSRRYQALTLPARVLRPLVSCTATRSAAPGRQPERKDRIAA